MTDLTLEDIVAKTKEQLLQRDHRPIFIMVAGGSATGKSSQLLPQLMKAFAGRAVLVQQDWYQLGVNFADKDNSPYRWDDPRNFQIGRLAADLRKLQDGQTVTAPSFDVVAVNSVGERVIAPQPVIIVDGMYSLYGELADIADYGIYVSMPLYGRFLRRLFRTLCEEKQDKPQTVFKQMFGPVLKAHQDFVANQAQVADCVIEATYDFADTIERYKLQPQGNVPAQAEQLFSHEGLCFYGADADDGYRFYIEYQEMLYYDFVVAEEYRPLLDGLAYLST